MPWKTDPYLEKLLPLALLLQRVSRCPLTLYCSSKGQTSTADHELETRAAAWCAERSLVSCGQQRCRTQPGACGPAPEPASSPDRWMHGRKEPWAGWERMQRSHRQGCWAAQEGPRVKMCLHGAFIRLALGIPPLSCLPWENFPKTCPRRPPEIPFKSVYVYFGGVCCTCTALGAEVKPQCC